MNPPTLHKETTFNEGHDIFPNNDRIFERQICLSHENQSGRDSAKCPATLHVEELRGSQSANDRPQCRADQNRDLQLLSLETRPVHRRGRPLSLSSPGSWK